MMDAFTRGKLVEIGAQKMLEQANSKKQYELNFSIISVSQVKDEPDITAVVEDGSLREPNLFVEIKGVSTGDRWFGLTEEQLATMERNSLGRSIVIMYISLSVDEDGGDNPKRQDPVGMYLKAVTEHSVFNPFAELNASAKLEFIITAEELREYGARFPKGDLLYETDLFCELQLSSVWAKDGNLGARIAHSGTHNSYRGKISVPLRSGKEDKKVGQFDICGSFEIYRKENPKSRPSFIHCLDDTTISNDIFGTFNLRKDKLYEFNLWTVGWDPVLKRNNLWISNNRVKELLAKEIIKDPDKAVREVADRI